MNQQHKIIPTCVYSDFIVFESIDKSYVLDQSGLWEVEEIFSLPSEEYENLSTEQLLDVCKLDYNFSGELESFEKYAFWAIVKDGEHQTVKSDDAMAVINNVIAYAEEHFSGEDLYYFIHNILYDVIRI